jgi:two-component sensor histidine kinase/ActR/RegA family two-component response regulator
MLKARVRSKRENNMNPKILIVDDEPEILENLEMILVEEEFEVVKVFSRNEAVAIFEAGSFDLVITDMKMPGLTGIDVLNQVKHMDKDVEVIILTGNATLENTISALKNAGAYDYLLKPIEHIEEFLLSVNHALEHRKLRLERSSLIEKLGAANAELEHRVAKRTMKLKETIAMLQAEIVERKHAQDQIKASLKEKEVLLGEVYHRTKNNMQIICGLLSIQSMHIKDTSVLKIFEETENRIQSMSLVHQKLYQTGDLSSIDIKDLGNNLLTSCQKATGSISFHVAGDSVLITIDTAVHCGLILNELISNSLAHAFPHGRDGEIRISLHLSGNEIQIDFKDNGIGLPRDFDLEHCQSLGLGLVRDLAQGQLRGKVELKHNRGAQFHLRFKHSVYEIRI